MSGRVQRPRGNGLLSFALLLVSAMAVLSLQLHGPDGTRAGTNAADGSAYLPHAVRGDTRAPTDPVPDPSPAPTSTVGRPTTVPFPHGVYPLLQVATCGGAAPDTPFGVDQVRISPWFTVYAGDRGTGGRALLVPHDGGVPDRSRLLRVDLDAIEIERILRKLLDEVEFWDVPSPMGAACAKRTSTPRRCCSRESRTCSPGRPGRSTCTDSTGTCAARRPADLVVKRRCRPIRAW